MTKLEQDILNFELFQISVFLDEINEMLKKDMIILIKLKHKKYRAKKADYGALLLLNHLGYMDISDRAYSLNYLPKTDTLMVCGKSVIVSPKLWYLLN